MTTFTVGSGQQFSTIAAAVAAAQAGDTIQIQAGTYTNDFTQVINGLTIEGVGGPVNLVATQPPPNEKAYLNVAGNTTIENVNISGVSISDANGGNGAGIRYEDGNLVVNNVTLDGNQDGILANADPTGTITIENSNIYNNGQQPDPGVANTHNIYIGDIQQFTLTNSYVHDANVGHEVKSRAENTTITNNRIFDNSGTSSYSIDLPNGGNATITGNTIEQGPNGQNATIIAYGEEGGRNDPSGTPHAGTSLTLSNNTILNDLTTAAPLMLWNAGGATVTGSGNVLYGVNANQLGSGVPASAVSYTSTEPVLDTSSPITTGIASTPTPTPAPAPTVISGGTVGSGPDTLTVTLAEDAYQGDAQANVSLDGALLTATPITVTALHGAGASEVFTFKGTFGSGNHNVAVSFLNDAYGGTPSTDRNLYVDGITLDGTSVTSGTAQYGANAYPVTDPVELYSTGDTASYSVSGGTNPPAPTVISGGTVGSGPDTLTVTLAEDAYQGDAQANVSLDGALLTATPITVTALHGAGASEAFTFKGTFGSGAHTVGVSFLNDAYGGTPSLDRNLYVDGATLDGQASPALASGASELYTTSTQSFGVSGGTNPPTTTTPTQGDTLVLHLSEDAWQGDAQFIASLDGQQLGAAQAVTASHAAGGGEDFTYHGSFGIGPHDLAITFLNDAWGGTPSMDRNLYVNGATYDGAQVPNAAATLYTNSTVHFTVGVASTT